VIHYEQEAGHTASTEREETLLTERMKNREKNSTAMQRGEEEIPPPGTATIHCQVILSPSSMFLGFLLAMQNVHSARSASKKIITRC